MARKLETSLTEHTKAASDRMADSFFALIEKFSKRALTFIPNNIVKGYLNTKTKTLLNDSQYLLSTTEGIEDIYNILSQPGSNIKEVLIEQKHAINTKNLVIFDITSLPASELPTDPDEFKRLEKHLEDVNFSGIQNSIQTGNRFNSPRLLHHSGLDKWVMVITLKN